MWIQPRGFAAIKDLKGQRSPPESWRPLENVDWDVALRTGNGWYDRVIAALRLKDPVAKSKELVRIRQDANMLKKDLPQAVDSPAFFLGARSAKARGKRVGEYLIGEFFFAGERVGQAEDRHVQIQRNLSVAFALAAYHQEHGRYPEKLDALAPTHLAEVPLDLFGGKALIYRPAAKGYLLYSVGVNGRDDQGRSYDDNPPGDDLVVRMPPARAQRK
jgi:hypothetical protein